MASILCVDDEPTALTVLRTMLQDLGHKPTCVNNVEAAFTVIQRGGIDLIISDYRMPGTTGLEFVQRLSDRAYDIPLIMATGYGSIEHAVASLKAGAQDYITKPIRPQQLELVVDQALEFIRLRRENAVLRQEVSQLRRSRQIVGDSPALRRIMETVRTVASTRASVLLLGESGTGKELIARAIHEESDRADRAFISVNCAAMPEQLVESMLFGHEKGAFTGAVKQVNGAFERADRGTLLLDEISEMRLELQAKLLRVLQEQEFERVGGTTPLRVDVRVIATSNRDLATEVREGRFREDLFYRLSVLPIQLPPLRRRTEDIPALAHYFAQRTAAETGKKIQGFTPEAMEYLQRHSWPGNVRELAHAVERAVILARGEVLDESNFDLSAAHVAGLQNHEAAPTANGLVHLDSFNLAEAEAALIERALVETGNNRTRAAELLGISVRTLRNKLNKPG